MDLARQLLHSTVEVVFQCWSKQLPHIWFLYQFVNFLRRFEVLCAPYKYRANAFVKGKEVFSLFFFLNSCCHSEIDLFSFFFLLGEKNSVIYLHCLCWVPRAMACSIFVCMKFPGSYQLMTLHRAVPYSRTPLNQTTVPYIDHRFIWSIWQSQETFRKNGYVWAPSGVGLTPPYHSF